MGERNKFTSETAREAGKISKRGGTKNVLTKQSQEAFALLMNKKLDKLEAWIDEVAKEDKYKALSILAKFMPYFMPQLSKVDSENLGDNKQFFIQINNVPGDEENDEMK